MEKLIEVAKNEKVKIITDLVELHNAYKRIREDENADIGSYVDSLERENWDWLLFPIKVFENRWGVVAYHHGGYYDEENTYQGKGVCFYFSSSDKKEQIEKEKVLLELFFDWISKGLGETKQTWVLLKSDGVIKDYDSSIYVVFLIQKLLQVKMHFSKLDLAVHFVEFKKFRREWAKNLGEYWCKTDEKTDIPKTNEELQTEAIQEINDYWITKAGSATGALAGKDKDQVLNAKLHFTTWQEEIEKLVGKTAIDIKVGELKLKIDYAKTEEEDKGGLFSMKRQLWGRIRRMMDFCKVPDIRNIYNDYGSRVYGGWGKETNWELFLETATKEDFNRIEGNLIYPLAVCVVEYWLDSSHGSAKPRFQQLENYIKEFHSNANEKTVYDERQDRIDALEAEARGETPDPKKESKKLADWKKEGEISEEEYKLLIKSRVNPTTLYTLREVQKLLNKYRPAEDRINKGWLTIDNVWEILKSQNYSTDSAVSIDLEDDIYLGNEIMLRTDTRDIYQAFRISEALERGEVIDDYENNKWDLFNVKFNDHKKGIKYMIFPLTFDSHPNNLWSMFIVEVVGMGYKTYFNSFDDPNLEVKKIKPLISRLIDTGNANSIEILQNPYKVKNACDSGVFLCLNIKELMEHETNRDFEALPLKFNSLRRTYTEEQIKQFRKDWSDKVKTDWCLERPESSRGEPWEQEKQALRDRIERVIAEFDSSDNSLEKNYNVRGQIWWNNLDNWKLYWQGIESKSKLDTRAESLLTPLAETIITRLLKDEDLTRLDAYRKSAEDNVYEGHVFDIEPWRSDIATLRNKKEPQPTPRPPKPPKQTLL